MKQIYNTANCNILNSEICLLGVLTSVCPQYLVLPYICNRFSFNTDFSSCNKSVNIRINIFLELHTQLFRHYNIIKALALPRVHFNYYYSYYYEMLGAMVKIPDVNSQIPVSYIHNDLTDFYTIQCPKDGVGRQSQIISGF